MAIGDVVGKEKGRLRKALVPGAASVVGAGAGLLLTRKNRNLRAALPDLKDLGVGDVADDLRGKLESVLGKTTDSRAATSSTQKRQTLTAKELETRRQEREERRNRRRQRARA
jgi:hypothetical protein